jgi:DNA-binding NarL/FixJ family response regulator
MSSQKRKNLGSDKIYNVFNALQPHDRRTKRIISLFDDGYTYHEIADQLKLNPITVFDTVYLTLRRTIEAR